MDFQYINQVFEIYKTFLLGQDLFTAAIFLILGKIIACIFVFPGTPLTLLSGAIFGTVWGSIISIIGNVLGACASFIIGRFLFKDWVQNKLLKKYPSINKYEDRLFKNGFLTVIILRLIPLFPFNILNFALGVTEVKFKDYFFGTLIGIIPGTIAFVYLGESLSMLNYYGIILAILLIIILIKFTPKLIK